MFFTRAGSPQAWWIAAEVVTPTTSILELMKNKRRLNKMTLRLDTEKFIQGLFIDIKSKFKTQRKYGVDGVVVN